ncbi:MAG: hypothetical protein SV760_04445 [Halobacteria archaeon]|nr:hypothetical protein [Halobacteria archaeon]
MEEDGNGPDPPSNLSEGTVEELEKLDESELRSVIDYAQDRLRRVHPSVSEQIEAGENEEIVSVEEKDGYTEVVKKEPCAEGCEDCPHDAYLYHVREESHPEGPTRLHWSYIGRVKE